MAAGRCSACQSCQEAHGRDPWPGLLARCHHTICRQVSASKTRLPRDSTACSSHSHMTLGAGRRSRAARFHVGHESSVQAQAALPIPKLSPQRFSACSAACRAGLSLTCPTEKYHLHHFFYPSFLQQFASKRMQCLPFTPWRSRAFASLLVNLGL